MNQVEPISEYMAEIEMWERLISIFKFENVCLKTRLSEIVNSSAESETDELKTAENFQEEFIALDRVVTYLSQETKTQKKILERQGEEEDHLPQALEDNQRDLRIDFRKAKQLFSRVKYDFAEYIEAHCPKAE